MQTPTLVTIFILSVINSKSPMVHCVVFIENSFYIEHEMFNPLVLAENCVLTCLHAPEYETFWRLEKI